MRKQTNGSQRMVAHDSLCFKQPGSISLMGLMSLMRFGSMGGIARVSCDNQVCKRVSRDESRVLSSKCAMK